jgi:hypothetical protein
MNNPDILLEAEKANMKSTAKVVSALCLSFFSAGFLHADANACIPTKVGFEEVSLADVSSRFDRVDTVVVATLVKSRKALRKKKGSNDLVSVGIDTFRVDRRFKGRAKKGSYFTLTTILQGCDMGTANDAIVPDGMPPAVYTRQWLIYRNANEATQVSTASYHTQPLTWGHADIEFLELILARAK